MTTTTATLPDPRTPWLMRIPTRYEPVAVCLPHAGLGASAFSAWPVGIAGARVLPVQPPGHENRFRERCPVSVHEFAEGLARALRGLRPRPLLFVGHCGAVPFALEAARLLREWGTPATQMRLLASSWGAPHRDIYGPLNRRPLHQIDPVAEVTAMMSGRALPPDPELAEIYGDVLMDELRAMRGYRFDPCEGLPLPVTVLGWSDDAVVPHDLAHAGWDQLGPVRLRTLTGDHRAFWECGEPMRELIAEEVEELVSDAG